MTKQRIDEIFRDKLAGYSQEPTADALKKLNTRISGRKHRAWAQLAKLAAVLLIVAISAYVVGSWSDEPQNHSVARIPVLDPGKEVVKKNTDLDTSPEPLIEKEELVISSDCVNTEEKNTASSKPVKQPAPVMVPAFETNDDSIHQGTREQPEFLADSDSIGEVPGPRRYKVTITYKKSPAPPEPMLALRTKPKENNRVLIKLLARAQNFQVSEFSLAGIRGAKDELLNIERKDKKVSKSD